MRILVGLDGSPSALTAHGLVCSTPWSLRTQFLFVHAIDTPPPWAAAVPGGGWFQGGSGSRFQEARDALELLADQVRRLGHAVETRTVEGMPAAVLQEAAAEFAADLVIVGNRGRGPAASAFLGSTSAALVDHAPCPVLVARTGQVSRLLVATDGSPSAEAVPAILASWQAFLDLPIAVLNAAPAHATGTELLITPWAVPTAEAGDMAGQTEEMTRHHELVDRMVERLRSLGWRATGSVSVGDPAGRIVSGADEAGCDLIVTGSRGLGDLGRLLTGSVGHDVLLQSRVSVLVMRGNVPAKASHSTTPVRVSDTASV